MRYSVLCCTCAIMLALPLSAFAQESTAEPDETEAGEEMGEEAFRTLVLGRTLHYSDENGYYGSEHFDADGVSVTWRYVSGECQSAEWFVTKGLFCFTYDVPSCWRVRSGERLTASLIMPPDGAEGQVVFIDEIVDEPLDCPSALTAEIPSKIRVNAIFSR